MSEGKRARPPRKTARDPPSLQRHEKGAAFQSEPQQDAASLGRGMSVVFSPPILPGLYSRLFSSQHLWRQHITVLLRVPASLVAPFHLPSSRRRPCHTRPRDTAEARRFAERGIIDGAPSCGKGPHNMLQCLTRRQFLLPAVGFVDQCLMQVASWRLIVDIHAAVLSRVTFFL